MPSLRDTRLPEDEMRPNNKIRDYEAKLQRVKNTRLVMTHFLGDGSKNNLHVPQESQTISKRLASTNKKVTEVCQKVLCGIHTAKIIQLVARSKFT